MAKKEAVKQAKAGLSLLDGDNNGREKSKKSSKKAKEATAATKASDQEMQGNSQADLMKAKETIRTPRVQ